MRGFLAILLMWLCCCLLICPNMGLEQRRLIRNSKAAIHGPTAYKLDRVRRGSMSALRLINILDESNKRLREEHPHISCLPYAMCQNLYGIDPQHFVTYGNISPIEYNCLYHQGLALCVTPPDGPGPTPPKPTPPTPTPTPRPTPTPPKPTFPTPSPPIPTIPTPTPPKPTPTTPSYLLPCVEKERCRLAFGARPHHEAIFGPQPDCPLANEVRCLVYSASTPTPTPAPTTSRPPCHSCGVQIIGPKPIYVTLSNVVGPTVNHNHHHQPKAIDRRRPATAAAATSTTWRRSKPRKSVSSKWWKYHY